MIGEFVYVGVGLVGDGQGVVCGIAAGGLVKGVYGAGQAGVQVGVADVQCVEARLGGLTLSMGKYQRLVRARFSFSSPGLGGPGCRKPVWVSPTPVPAPPMAMARAS